MAFLLFGTVWFWCLTLLTAGLIIYFLEGAWIDNDDIGGGLWSTILIIVVLTLYYFFGSKEDVKNLFIYLRDNPGSSIAFIGIYLVIGVVWSIFKWYFFLLNKRDKVLKRNDFWESDIPKAKDHKAKIISWMSYWPFSAFWTLLNDPIKRTFKFIYSKIEKVYEKMTEKVFADIRSKIKK